MGDEARRKPPECFARLDQVFPQGADGLRHTPPECLACDEKTECLRTALAGGQGAEVHAERLSRAYEAGQVGFLERWARQKAIEKRRDPSGCAPFWRRWLKRWF